MLNNNYFYISRSEFWNYFFQNKNAYNLMNLDKKEKKILFNDFVNTVYIETSSFCNRTCNYCPVALEGTREQKFMTNKIFDKIIEELVEIDYRGIISISLYNEPLASDDILERIAKIKAKLPFVYVRMNSNGDYLNREFLEKLCSVGTDEILITQHMNSNEVYTDELANAKITKFFNKINLDYEITVQVSNKNISVDMIYKGLRLLVVTNNWEEYGNSRGGTVSFLNSKDIRIAPCNNPFREIAIDINGNYRSCCNLYVTTPSNFNVKNTNVIDYFLSSEMHNIRTKLLVWGENKPKFCQTCNTTDSSLNYTQNEWSEFLNKSGLNYKK